MSEYEIINSGVCDLCGSKMKTVKGTETPTMLECPNCGQYAYEIFGVLCLKEATFKPLPPREDD